VLPVVNAGVVNMAVRFGLATDAHITHRSQFARKNYFYPDLPKGYQISQMALPIVGVGAVTVSLPDGTEKTINITRAHLEEDAGKSVHDLIAQNTAVDLNRAGTPLLEIVSEPDMRSAEEAVAYARHIHALVRYIDICDGNMQEGSFRCDANVSVRPSGQAEFGTRAEIKNLNSFRFLERAILFEVERQIDRLESGQSVDQETRLYDADKDETRSMRSKEEANDYRYFPDPDLPPLVIDDAFIASVKAEMPELPQVRRARFIDEYKLNATDADTLISEKATADYFEAVLDGQKFPAKLAANWIIGELSGRLNKEGCAIEDASVQAGRLTQLLVRIDDGTISGKIGKQVFDEMWGSDASADDIIEKQGLKQITDTSAIEAMIDEVIAANPSQVEEYQILRDKLKKA